MQNMFNDGSLQRSRSEVIGCKENVRIIIWIIITWLIILSDCEHLQFFISRNYELRVLPHIEKQKTAMQWESEIFRAASDRMHYISLVSQLLCYLSSNFINSSRRLVKKFRTFNLILCTFILGQADLQDETESRPSPQNTTKPATLNEESYESLDALRNLTITLVPAVSNGVSANYLSNLCSKANDSVPRNIIPNPRESSSADNLSESIDLTSSSHSPDIKRTSCSIRILKATPVIQNPGDLKIVTVQGGIELIDLVDDNSSSPVKPPKADIQKTTESSANSSSTPESILLNMLTTVQSPSTVNEEPKSNAEGQQSKDSWRRYAQEAL